jgi:hypothetical protein
VTNSFESKPDDADAQPEEVPSESSEKASLTLSQLTDFQLLYLSGYVFAQFSLFFVGPLLLFFDWDDDTSYCIGIGLLHGVAINAAAWSALADVSIFVRFPLGACVTFFCSLSLLSMFAMAADIRDPEILVFGPSMSDWIFQIKCCGF